MSKLVVISKPNCGGCTSVKNKFDGEDVPYTSINGYENPDEVEKYSIMTFPVTVLLDDNDVEVDRVNGFNPPELDKLVSQL